MTRILPLVHDAATSGCGQPGEGAVRYAQRMAQHVARILASQQSQRIYLGRAPMAVTSKRERALQVVLDRKSTRLNSSHLVISYAVFCLKKKKTSKAHTS